MSPHSLLGLKPDADAAAIKRAFRRQAMRWHPDRNPDPAALEHFKALRAAYEQLLAQRAGADPDENEDDAADAATDGTAGASAHAASEPAGPRGADIEQDLEISLEACCLGTTSEVDVTTRGTCEACDGSGRETLVHGRLCDTCHGSGRLRSPNGLIRCGDCGGQGYSRTCRCETCGGSGETVRKRPIAVAVPPGLLDGDWLRVPGAGAQPEDGIGRPGDLRLRIRIAAHPLYTRRHRDLCIERPVSALQLLTGARVAVPSPTGTRECKVEGGDIHPRELRIPGAGIPGRRGDADGDLVVRLRPVAPRDADARIARLARALQDALEADLPRHLPDVAAWDARWLE